MTESMQSRLAPVKSSKLKVKIDIRHNSKKTSITFQYNLDTDTPSGVA